MTDRKLNFWGWGWEDEIVAPDLRRQLATAAAARMGLDPGDLAEVEAPDISQIELRAPRIDPPASLESIISSAPFDRASHTYGKSFVDIVRGLSREFSNAPDLVAFPDDEVAVVSLLDWASDAGIAVIPFGGGSSVTGGVEGRLPRDFPGVVSLDMRRLDRVIEIDRESRAARIQAGALGPILEDQLRPEGFTLRHFPQSFEFSTLGGWIATRSGGHYATLYTHIDDFVESLRVVTPSGIAETRRLPGSGAGPSPDRAFIGSEGILGVITEAWMRIQDRPVHRATCDIRFSRFSDAVDAVREIAQAALFPTNCRILDPIEALTAGGDGVTTLLVLGFESADSPQETRMARALEICSAHGGTYDAEAAKSRTDSEAGRAGAVGSWRSSFLRAPYTRDALAQMGLIVETFETAVTWDRFESFHQSVMNRVRSAALSICGNAWVSCRFTHVYPDGPAPYYTVVAASKPDSQISQWNEIKEAASEALLANGGTITHHHSVGRDHRRWYDRQRPELFASALRAAKSALDPAGILNPGVLIDP